MHRLLIAESGDILGNAIKEQLEARFLTEVCKCGKQVLELMHTFEPDILLLDLALPDMDGLNILHTIRSCSFTTKVIVITNYASEHTLRVMESLDVCQVFRKPCAVDHLVSSIHALSFEQQDPRTWCLDLEIDRLFFSLGFRPIGLGYPRTHEALRMKYLDWEATVTKHVYPALVKKYSGNVKQTEKLIHNTIKNAVKRGDKQIWKMYFPYLDDAHSCPGNDEFLSRMEYALRSVEHFRRLHAVDLDKAQ